MASCITGGVDWWVAAIFKVHTTTFGPKALMHLGWFIDAGVGSEPRSLGGGGSPRCFSGHLCVPEVLGNAERALQV